MTTTGRLSASSISHYPSSLSSNWCAHPFIAGPSPQPISLSQKFGQLVSTQPTTPPASVPELLSSSVINDRTQYQSLSQNFGQSFPSGSTIPPISFPQLLFSSPSPVHNQNSQRQRTAPTHTTKKIPSKKKQRTKVTAAKKPHKKQPRRANSSSPSSHGRIAMELKIDTQPPRQIWKDFAVRLIPNDLVYFVVKYHAYMINKVVNINFDENKSTSGNATKKGRRVYVCSTGRYKMRGVSDCKWKIILKKEIGQTWWSMEKITPTDCTCLNSHTSIDVTTLINQPDFQLLVKKILMVTNR